MTEPELLLLRFRNAPTPKARLGVFSASVKTLRTRPAPETEEAVGKMAAALLSEMRQSRDWGLKSRIARALDSFTRAIERMRRAGVASGSAFRGF